MYISSKHLSAKYYQKSKERLQRKLVKDIIVYECYKNLSEDERTKLVQYRKNIRNWEKLTFYNYEKALSFRTICLFIIANIRNVFLSCLCLKSFFSTKTISSHPIVQGILFILQLNHQSSQKVRRSFFENNKNFFQGAFFTKK